MSEAADTQPSAADVEWVRAWRNLPREVQDRAGAAAIRMHAAFYSDSYAGVPQHLRAERDLMGALTPRAGDTVYRRPSSWSWRVKSVQTSTGAITVFHRPGLPPAPAMSIADVSIYRVCTDEQHQQALIDAGGEAEL